MKEHLLDSKAPLGTVIVAVVLVILAPLLCILTRKQIQYASEKDLKNLSGEIYDRLVIFNTASFVTISMTPCVLVVVAVVFKKEPEDEAKRPLNCSDLYIFSPDERAKATDSFNNSNLIGEGTLGMMVMTT